MADEPRAYTSDELRDRLLDHVRTITEFWADPKLDRDIQERCNGVAFSILAMLDGSSEGIPCVDLVFQPTDAAKDYDIKQGQNWIEPGTVVADTLHDHFYWRDKE